MVRYGATHILLPSSRKASTENRGGNLFRFVYLFVAFLMVQGRMFKIIGLAAF
jgi:hypothetical protein